MKVPEVVQTTRMMMTHIATDGPESQSHSDAAEDARACAQRGVVVDADQRRAAMWSSPRESAEPLRPVDAERI